MRNEKQTSRSFIQLGAFSLISTVAVLALSGCGGSGSSAPVSKTYQITVQNLTGNQPLSPVAIIAHKSGYQVFEVGKSATEGLEYLAEGGSNIELLAEAKADADYISSSAGTGAIAPGGNESVSLELGDAKDFQVSVATMLVNTNDAFAAEVSSKVDELQVGERLTINAPAWDAGTEANSESVGTLPGPVDGGEGFSDSRVGDSDFVAIHQGVVTSDDGLATSVLNESHRFDNPVARIIVERTE